VGQARRVAWVEVNEDVGPNKETKKENGPHKPISSPIKASSSGVDLTHVEVNTGEASGSGLVKERTSQKEAKSPEPKPSPVIYSEAAAASDKIRCGPIVVVDSEKYDTSLISMVGVDLASVDTNMENLDEPARLTLQEELVAFPGISGREMVLRSNATQLQVQDTPECGELPQSPLLCVPLAIMEPLD
jgi:hypothetical protein